MHIQKSDKFALKNFGNMKKVILTIVAAAFAGLAGAQEKVIVGNKFLDNWYFGVNGAWERQLGDSYMNSDKNGGLVGFELGKQATPVLGVSFQALTGINTTSSANALDELQFVINGKVNFSNLFWGYKGEPRLFEVEGILGAGGGREFYTARQRGDNNYFLYRVGLGLNFNLGKEKQWTLGVRPALVTKLGDSDPRNTSFELMAGLVYHFKCSNGKRHMSVMNAYSQDEVDRLNEEINDMRRRVKGMEKEVDRTKKKNKDLVSALKDCNKAVETAKENNFDMSMEPVVSFRQGQSRVEAQQLSNIENIANYMKKCPEVKLDIKGYASPEGNANFNQKLSERRANTVKEILVNRYGIEADRITAQGMGVGDKFSKPEMNRAIIATFCK